jgi:hypothetical protein
MDLPSPSVPRLPKSLNQYIFTLKMATAKFAETMDNFQHSTGLIPDILI